jgi:hypothetical protein
MGATLVAPEAIHPWPLLPQQAAMKVDFGFGPMVWDWEQMPCWGWQSLALDSKPFKTRGS